ncbi:MAG: hypothetical protein QW735_02240 [archaeon]
MRLQMGTISSFEHSKLIPLLKDFKKYKNIKVEFWHSELPLFCSLSLPKPIKKVNFEDCNHVIAYIDGKKAFELYGKPLKAGGMLYEKNLSQKELSKLEEILSKHEIYTFRKFKEVKYIIRYNMLISAFLLLFLSLLVLISSIETQNITYGLLSLLACIYSTILVYLYSG